MTFPPAYVYRIGGEAIGLSFEVRLEVRSPVGAPVQRRTTGGAAIDGKVDARVTERGSDDPVFDVVEAQRVAAGDEALLGEETVEAALYVGDADDGQGVEDTAKDEGVVRIDPVGEPVASGGETIGAVAWTTGCQRRHVAVEPVALQRQPGVVDASGFVHTPGQHTVEQVVAEGRFHLGIDLGSAQRYRHKDLRESAVPHDELLLGVGAKKRMDPRVRQLCRNLQDAAVHAWIRPVHG